MATEKDIRAAISQIESVETLRGIFKDMADALRAKGVDKNLIYPEEYAGLIRDISTGINTDDATALASDILSGKIAYGAEGRIIGNMPNAGAITGQLGATSGANWSTADPNRGSGKVTITNVNQTAGYTNGLSNGSITIDVPANRLLKGRTVTPTTSQQTIANAEDIAYGAINVAGDANLIPANIVSGKSIFGVSGNARTITTPGSKSLYLATVPGTTYNFISYYFSLSNSKISVLCNSGTIPGLTDSEFAYTQNCAYMGAANLYFLVLFTPALYNPRFLGTSGDLYLGGLTSLIHNNSKTGYVGMLTFNCTESTSIAPLVGKISGLND